MKNSIELLAKELHEAWRLEKIKLGWHIPEKCPNNRFENNHKLNIGITCDACHPCVNEWEKLTDKEKELPLQNSKIAHNYFEPIYSKKKT